ncbi:MAG: AMMECR1 domain protein [Candidatus Syntrophoarchaeum caldarius]|uniref:Protein SCAL_001686 n=1 Tax=Candidatus Syntropharchaeum caldarium TaxID=1838285 RepID=A0A1F2P823_9EURY|nr:MAG: AMMECR1 domain protein [Candidatus Syntrophoarchaeum caldarius]
MLSEEEGKEALRLARDAIEAYIRDGKRINPDEYKLSPVFDEKRGVFVTINKQGALRGCIGFPYPVMQLKNAIVEAAISAASSDPRFPSLSPDELEKIELEVTVLTEPIKLDVKPKDRANAIIIGKHGLIVRNGPYQGLLLPQVALEWGWDAVTFLEQTCLKAGLTPDMWLDEKTDVSIFEGQIFREERH